MKTFLIDNQNVASSVNLISSWIKERTCGRDVVLGMSGGIDCSVVARLCQIAEIDVHLVLLPYGDDMKNTQSNNHAMELIKKFNFAYHVFDIKPAVDALTIPTGSSYCGDSATDLALARANIRPRVRMTYLYQLAQINNRLVIGTGNLSERTVGYFTKWGDGACDLNPLGLLTKQEVYLLAQYLEIPSCIINKKPSAGLWEGQTDEDELGLTYDQIDEYINNGTSGNLEIDLKIEKRIALSEHKNREIPIYGFPKCLSAKSMKLTQS